MCTLRAARFEISSNHGFFSNVSIYTIQFELFSINPLMRFFLGPHSLLGDRPPPLLLVPQCPLSRLSLGTLLTSRTSAQPLRLQPLRQCQHRPQGWRWIRLQRRRLVMLRPQRHLQLQLLLRLPLTLPRHPRPRLRQRQLRPQMPLLRRQTSSPNQRNPSRGAPAASHGVGVLVSLICLCPLASLCWVCVLFVGHGILCSRRVHSNCRAVYVLAQHTLVVWVLCCQR